MTTTLPTVGATHNGRGTAAVSEDAYDNFGRFLSHSPEVVVGVFADGRRARVEEWSLGHGRKRGRYRLVPRTLANASNNVIGEKNE